MITNEGWGWEGQKKRMPNRVSKSDNRVSLVAVQLLEIVVGVGVERIERNTHTIRQHNAVFAPTQHSVAVCS